MFTYSLGRIAQVGVALYLLPVLMLVLAVGMIGMVVLGSTRFVLLVVSGPPCAVRGRAGLESLRS